MAREKRAHSLGVTPPVVRVARVEPRVVPRARASRAVVRRSGPTRHRPRLAAEDDRCHALPAAGVVPPLAPHDARIA